MDAPVRCTFIDVRGFQTCFRTDSPDMPLTTGAMPGCTSESSVKTSLVVDVVLVIAFLLHVLRFRREL